MTNLDNNLPPQFLIKLLKWFCDPELYEDVLGDLQELFKEIYEEKGKQSANFFFTIQVLLLFRPGIIKGLYVSDLIINKSMLFNYLKTTWRNVLKYKTFSAINALSLTLGLAACMVIFLFIKDEQSFDQQHRKKETLYRLCEVQSFPGTNTQNVALSMPGMGPTLVTDFPEIKSYARYWNWDKMLWQKDETALMIDVSVCVDSNFITMFDFPLIEGDKNTALNEPNSIIISEEVAQKFFGDESPLNKSLMRGENMYVINGVFENVPETSHLQFDILMSMATVVAEQAAEDQDFNDRWGSNFLVTYLELVPGVDIEALESKFPDYLRRQYSRVYEEQSSDSDPNDYYKLFLQPFTDVHLGSTETEHDYQNYRKFNGDYLDIFVWIGICLLIIASVNFMNLTMARANSRGKEVGVRKSIGARSNQLFNQFILESCLFALASLLTAFLINLIALPYLNELVDRHLSLAIFIENPILLAISFGLAILLGLLSGLYPSLYLSSFKPVIVLKGINKVKGKSVLRSGLVVLQFSLAIVLIVGTIVVMQQLSFMTNKDIGFEKDQILLVTLNQELNESFGAFKTELMKQSSVIGVTASGQRLGNNLHQWGFKMRDDTSVTNFTPSVLHVEHDFIDVYGIDVKMGRNFDEDIETDSEYGFIINNSLASEWGGEKALAKEVGFSWYHDDTLGQVIGVVEDFNFNSLHFDVNNLLMFVQDGWGYQELSVKLEAGNIEKGIQQVEAVYNQFESVRPFEYSFLDTHMDMLYRTDQHMGVVVTVIATLSILIGCMGLFGLSAITIRSRIKEIGVRKVHGATNGSVMLLLSKNFAFLIISSFLVAVPITYLLLSEWLTNFAFRIEIQPIVFIVGLLAVVFIAMLTISSHTIRVARTNPVKSLRTE